MGARADDPPEKLLGHLATVESGPLLEGAGHAGKIPGILRHAEAIGQVLRPERVRPILVARRVEEGRRPRRVVADDFTHGIGGANNPGVVGQAAAGVRPLVIVNEFAGGRHAVVQVFVAEGEVDRVFDEMKQVGVGTGELPGAVDAECVVPDHPAPAVKADLLAGQLQLGGIFIADRQPESALRLENAVNAADPRRRPLDVFPVLDTVLVDVVIVTDVERRVGKCQVDLPFPKLLHPLDAVALIDPVWM